MLYSKIFKIFGPPVNPDVAVYRETNDRFLPSDALINMMSEENIDVRAEVEAAVRKGQYADRAAAIAGLQKQLVDYQKGALRDILKGAEPVPSARKVEDDIWKELLEKAGGDEDKAVQLYLDELKKLKL
jgi:hypothetical protein